MSTPTLSPGGEREWTERQLAAAWAAGDETARAEAYRRLWPELVTYLRAFADCHADAEDLAQEAWHRIDSNADRFDPARPLWPWMSVIAKRVALNRYRQAHGRDGRPRTVVDVTVVDAHAGAEEDHGDSVALHDAVTRGLEDLAPRQRAALLVSALGLSAEEGGQRLGLHANGFRQLRWRGRERLEQILGRGGLAGLAPLVWLRRIVSKIRYWTGTSEGMTYGVAAAAAGVAGAALLVIAPFSGLSPAASPATADAPAPKFAPPAASDEKPATGPATGFPADANDVGADSPPPAAASEDPPDDRRPAVAPLPEAAVPGTEVRGHQEPIENPDYRVGATVPIPGATQTVGVVVEDDPRTSQANDAACTVGEAGDPVTYCERGENAAQATAAGQ